MFACCRSPLEKTGRCILEMRKRNDGTKAWADMPRAESRKWLQIACESSRTDRNVGCMRFYSKASWVCIVEPCLISDHNKLLKTFSLQKLKPNENHLIGLCVYVFLYKRTFSCIFLLNFTMLVIIPTSSM